MDAVGKIVMTACLLSVGISVLEMLYPNGKFHKQLKLLFSMVFIISLAGPVLSESFEFPTLDFSQPVEYSDLQMRSEEEFISLTEENIAKTLSARLESQNVLVKEISVKINISDDRSISISEVKIICSENGGIEKARLIAENEVGAEAVISVTEERGNPADGEN